MKCFFLAATHASEHKAIVEFAWKQSIMKCVFDTLSAVTDKKVDVKNNHDSADSKWMWIKEL